MDTNQPEATKMSMTSSQERQMTPSSQIIEEPVMRLRGGGICLDCIGYHPWIIGDTDN
jgi:hypothetical protein